MHIGIVSHVSTQQLSEHLYLDGNEPKGTDGATAPNLLIIELLKRGYKISVFSLTTNLKDNQEYHVKGENLNIYFYAYQNRVRDRALSLFKNERQYLKKKILLVNPDIIHAHWQYEYSWAALSTGINTIVTCRDSPVKVLLLHRNLYRFIRLVMAMIVLYKAKFITATSSYLADEIKKLVLRKKVLVIPNFEPDWLYNLPLIKDKNLKKPKLIMINNGFDARKNVESGILAFQLVRETYPDAELHLYGKGYSLGETANQWAKDNNVDKNITYKGYCEFNILMEQLRYYEILVHPSREETFGNILTESMALGVPVVGGKDSGSVAWVVGDDQKGGKLVDINIPEKIKEAILEILDEENYDSFAINARKISQERFSAKHVIDEYIKLYHEINLQH